MSIVKKRYFYLLHPVYHVFAALIVIIMLAAFIVNVLRLSDAAGLTSYNHPLDVTACVVTVLAAALLSSFVWGSGYTLGKSALYINLGPFVRRVPYDDILKMRSDEKRTALAMYYAVEIKGKKEEAEAAVKGEMIRIKRDDYDAFAKSVAKLSKRAEYEIVGSEEEE